MRLHVTVLRRRYRYRDQLAQREMIAERVEAAMRVRNGADDQAPLAELGQDRRHIVVELEVMVHRPLVVDLPRHLNHLLAAAAHALDDRRRVVHEQIVVVDLVFDFVEDERRGGGGGVELRRIDLDARRLARAPVAFCLKRRSRIDQREIDVEKDRADHKSSFAPVPVSPKPVGVSTGGAGSALSAAVGGAPMAGTSGCGGTGGAGAGSAVSTGPAIAVAPELAGILASVGGCHGPATAIVALSGFNRRRAAPSAASFVTALISPGNRSS